MKKCMLATMIGLAVGLGFANSSRAEERAWSWSPLGVGLAAPAQLPFMESDVWGLRFGGFLGFNKDVYGVDFGIAEMTTGDLAGLQGSLFSWTEGKVWGVQYSVLANVAGNDTLALQCGGVNTVWGNAAGVQLGAVNYDAAFVGLQFGGILNWNNSTSCGAQFGLVNADQDQFVGWSAGLVNYAGSFKGFQLGLFNSVEEVTGYQLGLVNACSKMRGVQVGLVNIVCEGPLPIMVLANASF